MAAVARAARVSAMTVSNVVNQRFDMMSAATRTRVERAITRLGYRQHASARSLRLAQRFAVGMVVVDPSPAFMADPFITQIVAGLCNVLGVQGFSLTLAGATAQRLQHTVVLRHNATDALCVMLSGPPAERRRHLRRIAALRQPIVLIQETMRVAGGDLCSVRQDDFVGAQALAQRVVQQGARTVLVLVPSLAWPAIEARQRGIEAAMRGRRGARVITLACGNEDFATTQAALDECAARHGLPDAIMAANDQMGIAALKWLRLRGVRVPQDILLTGFNAFDFWQYTDPVLTTVRSPAYELGEASGRAIMQRLTERRFAQRDIVLPVTLVPGGTA
jgi:LacI family transcriptional regulator